MVKPKVLELMTEQIKNEFESSYLYLSMAAYFHAQNLDGMATWMRTQAHEEWVHGMKLMNHLIDRGANVELADLKQHKLQWSSVKEAWADAYKHEQFITGKINTLMQTVRDEKDYAAEPLVSWFVAEQVEEEANASKVLGIVEKIKDSANGLFMIDGKLAGRPYPEGSPFA